MEIRLFIKLGKHINLDDPKWLEYFNNSFIYSYIISSEFFPKDNYTFFLKLYRQTLIK